MKQKLYAMDAFFIEKLKLSENDPDIFEISFERYKIFLLAKRFLGDIFLPGIWKISFVDSKS